MRGEGEGGDWGGGVETDSERDGREECVEEAMETETINLKN